MRWQLLRVITSFLLVLGLLLGLACQRHPTGLAGLASIPAVSHQEGGTPVSGDPAAPPGLLPAPSRGVGYLDVAIRWPRQSPEAYSAQLIPQSTNRLSLSVKNSLLAEVATASLERVSADQLAATASLELQAGQMDVEARAFRVVGGTATEVAKATLRVTVVANARIPATLTLGPTMVPAVTAVAPLAGKAGDTITVEGTNFGEFDSPFGGTRIPVVTFNGATASVVTPVSGTALQVRVPDSATVGPVRVVVDGVPSGADSVFWPVKSFSISASRQPWDTTAADKRLVLATKTLQFAATASYAFTPGSSQAQFGSPPAVQWSATNGAAGAIDPASGLYQAADNSQTAQVKALLGGASSNAIDITGVVVVGINISPQLSVIGLPTPVGQTPAGFPTTVQLAAQASYSSPVTLSGVKWKTSDNSKATVDSADGLVTSVALGTATITATSIDDPRVSATASVRIENEGLIDVIID